MPDKSYRILIADDDEDVLEFSRDILSSESYDITSSNSEKNTLELLKNNKYNLLITDRKMEHPDSGINLLRWVKEHQPDTGVIVVTSYAEVKNAVEAMKCGALDYIEKPFDSEAFKIKVKSAVERMDLIENHRKHLESYNALSDMIIGSSSAIRNILDLTSIYARSDGKVLITGETGVGKELIARRIHNLSDRRDGLFVECNAGAIAKEMIASELFGHVKGAFTGAINNRTGRFELADKGTLFLDEIGELDINCQTYLLRVLENKKFEKLGSDKTIEVDVRIIAGTNRNLQQAINEGKFREDLYYRIAELPIEIPPLRERNEDIIPIAEYFLMIESEILGKKLRLSRHAKKMLKEYSWPGNVRMLKNKIHLAAIHANHQNEREIQTDHLNLLDAGTVNDSIKIQKDATLDEYHREILKQMLLRHNNNKRKVAGILEVTEATIHNWIKKFY